MLNPNNAELRTLREDDLEMVLHWRNHTEIRKWMINSEEIALVDHLKWFENNKNKKDRSFYVFEYQNIPQGYVSFVEVSNSAAIEWGFYLKPDAERGMGNILGYAALNTAFGQLQAEKVFGQVLAFNEKSLNFHKKLGFSQEGVLRKHFKDYRGEFDIHQFGLLRNEWLKGQCYE